jgi:hypothetical protein
MTRRRLILAVVAAVLFGTAWWLSLDRLSAEERLLVGAWTFDGSLRERYPRPAGLTPWWASESASRIGLTTDAQSL